MKIDIDYACVMTYRFYSEGKDKEKFWSDWTKVWGTREKVKEAISRGEILFNDKD